MAYYKPEELENIRKGLEWAKKNPTDPKSLEIQNRLKSGQLNFELKALGLKEVPVQVPKIVMPKMPEAGQMSTPSQTKPTMGQTMKETGKDILETGSAIAGTVQEGAQNLQDIMGNENFNPVQKTMGVLGSLFGTGAKTIADVTTGVGKVALSQEAENQLKSFVQEKAQGIAENETVKKVADWYGNLPPDEKLIVDSAGGFASLVSEILAGGTAGKVATPLKEGVGTAVETGIDLTKAGLKKADEFSVVNNANRVAKQEAKVDEAVARIIQGTPDDIATAKKALMEVDTDGVKTYAELNERMGETLDTLRKKVDQELDADPTVYTKFKLARKTEVKGLDGKTKTVYDNPTLSALDELEDYYTKIKDIPNKTKVTQYKQKLETEGLRLKEINDIARMHGKDLNAFNANGELASGLSKQAAENTRKGLKEVVRQNMPDDKTRALDESMSNILRTQDLTKNMETKVQKLYQKVKNRTLAQKVGGAVADVVDLASFGTLRGFVQKLLPSNVGLKTANSLDLEKELSKNLAQIDKLLEIKDEKKFTEAMAKYLEEVQPGLSTRVTSGLSNAEKDALLGKLNNIKSTDLTSDVPSGATSGGYKPEIDLELSGRLDELKAKSEKAGGLTEREYAELKVLMDEVELNTNQTIAPSFNEGEIPKTKGASSADTLAPFGGDSKVFDPSTAYVSRNIDELKKGGVDVKSPDDIITVYHGTSAKNAEAIARSGFNPGSFFSTDKNATNLFAGESGKIIPVKVAVKDLGFVMPGNMAGSKGRAIQTVDHLYLGENGVYSTKPSTATSGGFDAIDERLKPLADKDGMVTVYRASATHPKDVYTKDTFFATQEKNARYYGESWYKGNPSDLEVRAVKMPASLLKRGGSSDAWQLKEDFKIPSNSTPNPLYTEARKYKSAEEFYKARKANHFTNEKFDTFDISKTADQTIWFTTKNTPEGLAATGGDVKMERALIPKKVAGWEEYDAKSLSELQRDGYDLVELPDNGFTDYIILDPSIIKTRSQLTDIWKKANGQK